MCGMRKVLPTEYGTYSSWIHGKRKMITIIGSGAQNSQGFKIIDRIYGKSSFSRTERTFFTITNHCHYIPYSMSVPRYKNFFLSRS